VAAGAGTRLPGPIPKPFLPLGGQSVLERTVSVFQRCAVIDQIVVVVAEHLVPEARSRFAGKVAAVVAGGEARQDSVAAGLGVLPDADWVVVHDGARPFVSEALVARVLESARLHGAATAGLPMGDTVKQVENGRVQRTVERSSLWTVQTPQAFRAGLLRDAHARARGARPATDDAELVERLGEEVVVVPGDGTNLKITTPQDLELARLRVATVDAAGEARTRVGIGYDVHPLVPDRRLVLGGVTIPYARGLDGHSDADVVAHAIMDALLGAAGAGDIGQVFPPGDPAHRDADSLRLLEHVTGQIQALGWAPENVDVVVIAEEPMLAPHIERMRARLATVLGVAWAQVSVKATTGKGLGALGRGEGIAAQAVALIRRMR
jgi:2-C-methyl-D-erythritol 4-phosphate cytidylyltransferase/2-C-methyl-D-erythritol 2,4-cyclodiphosphate synthase